MDKTNEVKVLLNQLYTEEGRAHVINALVERGYISKEYVERTVDFWETKKEYQKAHDLARKAGMQKRAHALEAIVQAAQQRTEEDETEKDEIRFIDNPHAEKIIHQYEQAGESWNSVELCVKAVDAYYTVGRFDEAVHVAIQHGLIQKALAIREEEKKWDDAATIAEAHGMYERAGINYEHAKESGKAGDCFVAEVEKRKNARKKSSNALVSLISMFTNILPPQDDVLLARALKNYTHAGWDESEVQTAVRIRDKKMVFKIYEKEAEFQRAEAYAASVGDIARQQLYKTIDYMIRPERGEQEKAKAEFADCQRELEESGRDLKMSLDRMGSLSRSLANTNIDSKPRRDQQYQAKMKEIKNKMQGSLNPKRLITLSSYVDDTLDLYEVCRIAAECALDKYGISASEQKEIATCLEEVFVKKHLLEEKYAKTMRTMYTLSTLIENKKIRQMDLETYTKYYREAAEFVGAMERIIGYTNKPQHGQNRGEHRYTNRPNQRGHMENVFNYVAYGAKLVAQRAAAETGYFYLKMCVLVPSVIALGLVGECSYLDTQINLSKDIAVMYKTNTGEQVLAKNNEGTRGCNVQH